MYFQYYCHTLADAFAMSITSLTAGAKFVPVKRRSIEPAYELCTYFSLAYGLRALFSSSLSGVP